MREPGLLFAQRTHLFPMKKPERRIVGWREWVALPDLRVPRIKAKLDTGARTSALHAFDVETYRARGREHVRFTVHPKQRDDIRQIVCHAPIVDRRWVINSGGHREFRLVIETRLCLDDQEWPIEVTLTNRDEMGFRMLIGRRAMTGRLIVDPARSYTTARTSHAADAKSKRKPKRRAS